MVERVDSIPKELIHRIGLLIIDEAHMFCTSNRIEQIFKFFPKYVIALTATPIRSDGRNKFLDYLVGNDCQITRLPPPYKVIRLLTGLKYDIAKKSMYNSRTHEYMETNDFSAYLTQIQKDKNRNEMIARICKKLIEYDRKIILMCRFKEHVSNISKELFSLQIKNDYVMGNKAKYKDSTVLLGTMSKMGTGFDEANVCEDFKGVKSDTLILTSSVKETGQLYQLMGRVFRSDNPLIIFLHDDFEVCKKHWNVNKKLLDSHDTEIEELSCKKFLSS
jgi:superfamily II DNA or RNA helicase